MKFNLKNLKQSTRKYRHAFLIAFLQIFQKSIQFLPKIILQILSIMMVPFACLFAIKSTYQIYQNLKVAKIYYQTKSISSKTHSQITWLSKPLLILVLKVWYRLFSRFFSFLTFDHIQALDMQKQLQSPNVQVEIENLKTNKDPHIIITAHLGNWEVLAMTLAGLGLKIQAVAGGKSDQPLLRFLKDYRLKHGVYTYQRGEIREILKQLSMGHHIIFLVDLLALSESNKDQKNQTHTQRCAFLGKHLKVSNLVDRIAHTAKAKRSLFILGANGYQIKSLKNDENAIESVYEQLENELKDENRLIDWIWIHRLFNQESIDQD